MIVRARTDSFEDAPKEVLDSGWSKRCIPHITTGTEYVVYAIAAVKTQRKGDSRLTCFMIEDKVADSWLPSFLFEVVDGTLPPDWRYGELPNGNYIIGPEFISSSAENYNAMVERMSEAVVAFREYRERMAEWIED
jgi:hypothetical protein